MRFCLYSVFSFPDFSSRERQVYLAWRSREEKSGNENTYSAEEKKFVEPATYYSEEAETVDFGGEDEVNWFWRGGR